MMPERMDDRDGRGGQATATGSDPFHPGVIPPLLTLWQAARWAPSETWKSDARQIQLQLGLRAEHGHQPRVKVLEFGGAHKAVQI